MFVKRCNLLTAVDKSEQAPHKSPPLNQNDYTTESASYATFTIEGNFQPQTPCVFLFITVGKLMPLFLGRRG